MKRGQMQLSFGMIFSIILIVIFISVAFYAILKFLDVQNSMKVGKFLNDFQTDVDRMWKGSHGSQEVEYYLPSKIEYVCFIDYSLQSKGSRADIYNKMKQVYYEHENIFFYPLGSAEGMDASEIEHINLEKITESENPYCVQNVDGKIKFTLKKNYDEATVDVTR
ncbi:MAG: hypothetical protein ABH804_00440 [archaeon]